MEKAVQTGSYGGDFYLNGGLKTIKLVLFEPKRVAFRSLYQAPFNPSRNFFFLLFKYKMIENEMLHHKMQRADIWDGKYDKAGMRKGARLRWRHPAAQFVGGVY